FNIGQAPHRGRSIWPPPYRTPTRSCRTPTAKVSEKVNPRLCSSLFSSRRDVRQNAVSARSRERSFRMARNRRRSRHKRRQPPGIADGQTDPTQCRPEHMEKPSQPEGASPLRTDEFNAMLLNARLAGNWTEYTQHRYEYHHHCGNIAAVSHSAGKASGAPAEPLWFSVCHVNCPFGRK
ncbi:hypothetical protein CGCVW01_v003014, partial [Colletotrichum viniferum]